MKVLFMGCVKSSLRFLEALYFKTEAEIVGVVTKVQSDYNADHVSLHSFCNEEEIDWLDYQNNDQLAQWVKLKCPDIIYCFGWSYLLPKEVYSIPKLGAVGYHPTLLPQNRGRHPIIWTLVLGLKETGSTFFYLDDLPDSGAILNQRKLHLDDYETASTLYSKLLNVGEQQVVELTNDFIKGTLKPIVQDEEKATYWRKRGELDGKIDWRMSSQMIINLINALSKPYGGAHFEYYGKKIKVWRAEEVEYSNIDNLIPGEIVDFGDSFFIIKTSDKLLKIVDYEGDFVVNKIKYL
ncbi:methionyl-tRNA formyltransferase [Metasolibacillus fluoroglycofenilyticus]|uniref:methionyl-tRNA formyltransferase n=1 Tax=Metasolibacillus fluoroglycofenilyticus TaxID=1239396 RepID=UPI00137A4D4C|nr:methionyl-tRNA formyltransferase [Metasolibacillus fluoroglycofenilyticus]